MNKITCECCQGRRGVLLLGCPSMIPCPICHGTGKIDESLKEAAIKERARNLGEIIFAAYCAFAIVVATILYGFYLFFRFMINLICP